MYIIIDIYCGLISKVLISTNLEEAQEKQIELAKNYENEESDSYVSLFIGTINKNLKSLEADLISTLPRQ